VYSTGIAYLLWFLSLFGVLGLHRFYLGKIPTGLLWMFTGGLFGIGTIYDFFTLPGQVRQANLLKALRDQPRNSRRDGPGWRHVQDGEARIVTPKYEKESPERIILTLAKENKGVLTVSEVALAADIPIEKAKNYLDNLVSKGFAELRVRQSGTLVYTLPDLMSRDEPLEDI
jgi:predicted transcriptional regulator